MDRITDTANNEIFNGGEPYEPPDGKAGYKDQTADEPGTQIAARDQNAYQEELVRFIDLFLQLFQDDAGSGS